MTTSVKPKRSLSVLGLGALACVACCAGPILAFLSASTIAGLAATTFIGATGFVIAVSSALTYVIVRRRRTLACKVRT